MRTASLIEIVDCIEQYNTVPKDKHRELVIAIKKYKLMLKRAHAKAKNPICELRQREEEILMVGTEIKLE